MRASQTRMMRKPALVVWVGSEEEEGEGEGIGDGDVPGPGAMGRVEGASLFSGMGEEDEG